MTRKQKTDNQENKAITASKTNPNIQIKKNNGNKTKKK